MKMLGNICEIMLPTSLTLFIQLLIDTAIIQIFLGHVSNARMIAGAG